MRLLKGVSLIFLFAPLGWGDLTVDEKLVDFQTIVGIFNKNYAPYEWKRDFMGYDLLDTAGYIERIKSTATDLEFYDICSEFISRLQDSHSNFQTPSTFFAVLGIHVDIYDGKFTIDDIQPRAAVRFPVAIGDELLAVDGIPMDEVVRRNDRHVFQASPRGRLRQGAFYSVARFQNLNPFAADLRDTADLQVRRANGNVETYTLPWFKTGVPLQSAGIVPLPGSPGAGARAVAQSIDEAEPEYLRLLRILTYEKVSEPAEVLNVGVLPPIWGLPAGFRLRLGRGPSDFFYSGTYSSAGQRIGYIRIPTFDVADQNAALAQFEGEIQFFQQNTDGLIVDVMRNSGGLGCYAEELQRRLIPADFRAIGREIRATWPWVVQFATALDSARSQGADPSIIQLLADRLQDVISAYNDKRGRTGPVATCTPSLIRQPAAVVYSKPLMLLVDEFSSSAAEVFAAVLQDASRGPLFGFRTNGAGGSVVTTFGGPYTDSIVRVTITMLNRKSEIVADGFPATRYVENIGVRPDIEIDYMTRDNLLQRGQPFVQAFTAAMVDLILRSPQ
jgi:Peptidase family S41/PDZ domain